MPRPRPSKSAICTPIEAAKACGLDVAGVITRPDGTVTVLDRAEASRLLSSQEDVSAWDRATGAGR